MAEVVNGMMRRFSVVAATLAVGLVSSSCAKSLTDPGFACTAVAIAGVYVTVQDRLTDSPPPFTGLWARARDGTYVDSTTMSFPSSVVGAVSVPLAYERTGTYTVTVHVDGYQEWERTGVVVTEDECHVIPVSLNARLDK
ncbi:MAG: hypothetical protein O2973_03175 [Gemmatimonadetes bacterium]|nr:hypothetical protein [Gemmatimonadota bacterium]